MNYKNSEYTEVGQHNREEMKSYIVVNKRACIFSVPINHPCLCKSVSFIQCC